MAKFTKQTLLSKYRSDYPDNKMDDNKLFYEILKNNPKIKNYVSDYKEEASEAFADYLPDVIKEGYNRSLTGQADELLSGKKRFDMSKWNPGVIEDISATAASLLMPTDGYAIGTAAKAGGTAFKLIYNGLVRSGVGKKIAGKAVKQAVTRVGAGAGAFSTYSGLGSALRQQIDTGDINIDEVASQTLKGGLAGAITGGVGGVLTAKGASSLTKVAAETGALGTVSPLLEGRAPTPDDYFHTAGVILGVKGGQKLFSSPKQIKELFQQTDKQKFKYTKEQADLIATGKVKDDMNIALSREEWVSPQLRKDKIKSFNRVRITNSTSKSYTVQDLNTNKFTNLDKNSFHKLFTRTNKDLAPENLRTTKEKEVRDYETKLGMSEGRRLGARRKFWKPDSELQKGEGSRLKSASDTNLFEYRQKLKEEYNIVELSNQLQKEGFEVSIPRKNFIDNYFPEKIAKVFEYLKGPDRLFEDPVAIKYKEMAEQKFSKQQEFLSSFVNQALELGLGSNPSRRKLKELGFNKKSTYRENLNDYYENMSNQKESGRLLEWNSAFNKMYKSSVESGLDAKGHLGDSYLPKQSKREIAEILFNDVQLASSKMVGASNLFDSFTNTGRWIKENPEAAANLENIIKRHSFSPQFNRVLSMNKGAGPNNLLKTFVDIGRTSFNDLYSVNGNIEKSRGKDILMPKEYYERNFKTLFFNYANGVAKRNAEVQVFGRKGEKFNAIKKAVQSTGSNKDVDLMTEVHNHVVGSIHKNPAYNLSPKGKKLAESVMAWETSTKIALGTATIPNMSQFMISSALDAGYLRFFRGVISLADPNVRKAIKKSGATEFDMLNDLLGTQSRTTAGAKIADGLSTLSFFKGINKINQYTSAATARIFMKDLHKISRTSKIETRRDWAKNKLERMGIDYKKSLSEKVISSGTNKYARDMNLQKDILQDPLIMNNPRYQWLFQFKRFGLRQAKLIDNVLREDLKKGNVMSVLRLGIAGYFGGTGVSIAKKYFKEFLSGEPSFDTKADLPEDFEDLVQGLSAVGALGMVGDLVSSAFSVGEKPSDALKFLVTPAVMSSADNIIKFYQRLESDAQTYGSDMVRRMPSRVSSLFGTVPSELMKRIYEPQGLGDERLEGRKAFAVKRINKYLDKNMFDKAIKMAELWNKTNPQNPISPRSISMGGVMRRMMEREKKKLKNRL